MARGAVGKSGSLIFDELPALAPEDRLPLEVGHLAQGDEQRFKQTFAPGYAGPQDRPRDPRQRQAPDEVADHLPPQPRIAMTAPRVRLGGRIAAPPVALPPLAETDHR